MHIVGFARCISYRPLLYLSELMRLGTSSPSYVCQSMKPPGAHDEPYKPRVHVGTRSRGPVSSCSGCLQAKDYLKKTEKNDEYTGPSAPVLANPFKRGGPRAGETRLLTLVHKSQLTRQFLLVYNLKNLCPSPAGIFVERDS